MICIISTRNPAIFGLDKKTVKVEILPQVPAGLTFKAGDQVYLDISCLTPAELKKMIALIRKSDALWSIIDPKGLAEDPASYFFEGASDYIGPALINKGLTKKRFNAAFSWAIETDYFDDDDPEKKNDKAVNKTDIENPRNQKLPTEKFQGWKSIRSGTTAPFFFLFISLSGNPDLRSLVGDIAFTAVKNRLREVLQQGLWEADALLWMESEESSLFLIPPNVANARAAVEAALKFILNKRLVVMENLGLTVHAEFTIALHYGQTKYQAPGKTGAVISETINYIFHLATRKAEPGRLTISDDVPEDAIPDGLRDLLMSAGEFEGIPIYHSKRFIYE